MKVKNHLVLCCFQYLSSLNPTKFVLGDVVTIIDDEPQVGVVIQIHDDGDVRTDMFGNYHVNGLRLSTLDEVKEHYPKILSELVLEKEYKDKVDVYNLIDIDNNGEIILTGTMNDIRTWLKNRWCETNEMVVDLFDIHVEEDWYYFVDANLALVISNMGYEAIEVCEVPIEDFE